MSVQKVEFTDVNFDEETRQGVSLLYFEEPCDIECQKLMENIEQATGEVTGQIKAGCCNVETCAGLAERFRVSSIPTILIFKDGQEVERLAGFRHEKALAKHLRKHLGK
ncbi:MAG: hypothetical protein JEZ10_03100 [Verrucomicrobia bacterium]|nr:hypothetical protein [Verrucomicrobiota bacterium]